MKLRNTHSILPILLSVASTALASAATQEPPNAVDARPPAAPALDAVDGGEGHAAAVALQTDDVPAPRARVLRADDAGDRLVAAASGDPHFLAFASGRHYPAPQERIDARLLAQAQSQYLDGRKDSVTYAFVMFSKRITRDRLAELEQLGCRTLGFHPHYCIKVAVPVISLDSVAALDFVRWVGVPTAAQKVHPRLAGELASAPQGRPIDVYVNVYESDRNAASTARRVMSQQAGAPGGVREAGAEEPTGEVWMSNGWQQRALQDLGVEVHEYVDRIRAFRASVLPAALEQLAELDFVQFVELAPAKDLTHDESMPQILSDHTRASYDGNNSLDAIAGAIDSGMDVDHEALGHTYWVGWDMSTDSDVTQDDCGHGSHVIGTILGKPPFDSEGLTGGAPDLGSAADLRFRIVKFLDLNAANKCVSQGSMSTAFSHMRSDFTDISGNVSPKPHAVNCSFSSPAVAGSPWIGSEADPRTIDAEVWDHSQLYVFGAGNGGISVGSQSISDNGSAKNAFTVGAVIDFEDGTLAEPDPGNLAGFSSIGPCGDGRWKPNVTAPGQTIKSVLANTPAGYANKQGTSMAAPHVTGLAAQLCDHYAHYRYAPHRIASLLMTTAMTHQDEILTTQPGISDTHLNSFGAGRVNAANAHFVYGGETQRINWGGTGDPGFFNYSDFDVDTGCVRLIVCVTYHEDQCSAGAAQALVNDWDLYLDSPQNGIDPAGDTGEYFAQQSSIDNTEMRTFENPQTGTWRWKFYPTSVTGSVRYSVTVQQIFADTTPNGTLTVTADDVYVQPDQDVEITASAYNPGYFASCVFLDSTSSGDALQESTTTLEDGAVTDLMSNAESGRDVLLGTIRIGDTRSATWTTRWATEGVKTWSVDARSDNWTDEFADVDVFVDGTPPSNVTNLHSTSHTLNVWSNDSSLDLAWTAATDAVSGLDGYSRTFSNSGSAIPPDTVKDIEGVTSLETHLGEGSWIFAIKGVDNCGNWFSGYRTSGPYKIDTIAPAGPTNLTSVTHTPNVQSCVELVEVQWTAATDAGSGLEGYLTAVNSIAAFVPSGTPNLGANATSYSVDIGSSASPRYVHVRAKDLAGNYGPVQHFGPLYVDANTVASYCTAKTNSLGCVPTVGSIGQPDLSDGSFVVTCANVVNNKSGLMYWGRAPLAIPFQGGTKCVAAPTVRTPIVSSGGSASGSDCTGSYAFAWTTSYLTGEGLVPGDEVYCQFWFRDPPSASTTGLSNALSFTVCD